MSVHRLGRAPVSCGRELLAGIDAWLAAGRTPRPGPGPHAPEAAGVAAATAA